MADGAAANWFRENLSAHSGPGRVGFTYHRRAYLSNPGLRVRTYQMNLSTGFVLLVAGRLDNFIEFVDP